MHFELIMAHLCCACGQEIFHPGANKSRRSVCTIRKYARNVKWDRAVGEESDKTSQFTRLFLFVSLYRENSLSFERHVITRYFPLRKRKVAQKQLNGLKSRSQSDIRRVAELDASRASLERPKITEIIRSRMIESREQSRW
jgi:hypothetical protein